MQGMGTFTLADGSTYVGEMHQDMRHGNGTMTLSNGMSFEGEWANDHRINDGVIRDTSTNRVYPYTSKRSSKVNSSVNNNSSTFSINTPGPTTEHSNLVFSPKTPKIAPVLSSTSSTLSNTTNNQLIAYSDPNNHNAPVNNTSNDDINPFDVLDANFSTFNGNWTNRSTTSQSTTSSNYSEFSEKRLAPIEKQLPGSALKEKEMSFYNYSNLLHQNSTVTITPPRIYKSYMDNSILKSYNNLDPSSFKKKVTFSNHKNDLNNSKIGNYRYSSAYKFYNAHIYLRNIYITLLYFTLQPIIFQLYINYFSF